ncbi:CAP domain-containing protein [Actinoplanes sp. NPDC051633]|uniref:CAP domain-containing protein n=1 Tax=Actinoplanes sp. NPDC051633 TaxID=3155670 RepID=UPI00342A8000
MIWKSLIAGLAVPVLLTLPAPASAAPTYSPTGMVSFELFTATNEAREKAGCPPLRADTELIVASIRQSRYMAVTRNFGHAGPGGSTFVTRARQAGYQQPAGENIAWGFRDPADVMQAWLASPAHRANILNCDARSIGAGVRLAEDGTPYYTQVFGWD